MIRKLLILPILVLSVLFLLGCSQQTQDETQGLTPIPTEQIEEDTLPATGEETVDQVGSEISEINQEEDQLDTSELDDLDQVLEDIENI